MKVSLSDVSCPFTIIDALLSLFLTDGDSTVQMSNTQALATWLGSAYTQFEHHCGPVSVSLRALCLHERSGNCWAGMQGKH